MDKPALSVVICTRDRPVELELCLERVCRKADDNVEFIMVDNCPSDDQAQRLASRFPVKYFREMRSGKSAAMNTGVTQCNADVVAFLDDDDFVEDGWTDAIVKHFEDPSVGYVSGLRLPFELRTKAQRLFHLKGGFSKGEQLRRFDRAFFERVRWRGVPIYLIGLGGNSAVRRSALLSVGGFDEFFGPGAAVWAAESTELCYRLMRAGYVLIYDPSITLYNKYVEDYKTLRTRMFYYGLGDTAIQTKFLLHYGDPRALCEILYYRTYRQWKRVLCERSGSDAFPIELVLIEWLGNLIGPFVYFWALVKSALG